MQREHLLTVQSSTTMHPPNKDVFLSPWYLEVGDGFFFSPERESLLLPKRFSYRRSVTSQSEYVQQVSSVDGVLTL